MTIIYNILLLLLINKSDSDEWWKYKKLEQNFDKAMHGKAMSQLYLSRWPFSQTTSVSSCPQNERSRREQPSKSVAGPVLTALEARCGVARRGTAPWRVYRRARSERRDDLISSRFSLFLHPRSIFPPHAYALLLSLLRVLLRNA